MGFDSPSSITITSTQIDLGSNIPSLIVNGALSNGAQFAIKFDDHSRARIGSKLPMGMKSRSQYSYFEDESQVARESICVKLKMDVAADGEILKLRFYRAYLGFINMGTVVKMVLYNRDYKRGCKRYTFTGQLFFGKPNSRTPGVFSQDSSFYGSRMSGVFSQDSSFYEPASMESTGVPYYSMPLQPQSFRLPASTHTHFDNQHDSDIPSHADSRGSVYRSFSRSTYHSLGYGSHRPIPPRTETIRRAQAPLPKPKQFVYSPGNLSGQAYTQPLRSNFGEHRFPPIFYPHSETTVDSQSTRSGSILNF